MVVLLADVQLAPEDRLDPLLLGRVRKMHRAIDIAVIGHRDRRLTQLFHAGHKFLDVAGAVEHGIVGMQVQMDEFWGHYVFINFSR